MNHIIRNIGVAQQIGTYSDAIAVGPNLRWLMTAGTPGLSTTGALLNDITGHAENAWEHILMILARAGMTVADKVKVAR